jgi:RNA polymerase sigma factor (sigma-70 family)
MMTNELLHRYAVDGSESAFTELVRQHIDLVYSAALRQVNGDAGEAQDITQAVFTDLARKASRLAGHTSLTGWLYTSARFQAAKSRRAEQRRHAREQESHAMNQLLQTNDTPDAWNDMRPVLDDVMHELNETDREAVLLRYFERKPLAEIGARLGLSENAARMRVDRALEKLRVGLSKRGVTSTGAALALALTERAVGAAPTALVAEISKSALGAVAVGGGVGSGLSHFFGLTALKWLVAAAALASLSLLLWNRDVQTANVRASAASESPVTNTLTQTPVTPAALPVADSPSLDTTNKLTLQVVTADTGKPVPSVEFDYWIWGDGGKNHRKSLHANRLGVCEVPVPRSTVTRLILVSQRDGFADTRLQWHTDQGENIPQEYTLRLPRATPIGGSVVDADGNPVSGAKIGFNNRNNPSTVTDPASELRIETSDFGWPFWIETTSDSTGHWQIDRIAREAIHTLEGSADDPEHLVVRVSVGADPDAEKQMVSGAYVFRLGRGAEVHGDVTDESGKPISDARVRVGYAAMSDTRKTKTGRDGAFSVGGCKPKKTPLSADAAGFATTTIEVDLTTNQGPFHLTLKPGKLLRLRVVDASSNALPNAWVFYDNMPRLNGPRPEPPRIQADFEKRTDADGYVEWDNAPDDVLHFDVSSGNSRKNGIQIRPDGEEHVVTLSAPPSPLTLFGSVTDATTGMLVPSFRIIEGWPTTNFLTREVGAQWSTLDRFWLKFEGGTFRHVFTETPLGGQPNPGFVFKFEADGYAAFVTRSFVGNEGENRLDVAMRPAPAVSITVLLPNGQPAAKADVGLAAQGSSLRLQPGGISRENLQSAESLLVTDETGHFSLSVDDTVKRIIIAHPEGFVQTTPGALAANTSIQLQPWSRIEGTLLYDGQPAPGADILLSLGNSDRESIASDFEKYKATTDGAGHFVFPQAPPGAVQLILMVPFDGGPHMKGWSNHTLTNLDIPPGETVTVTPTTTIAPGTTIKGPHALGSTQPPGQ